MAVAPVGVIVPQRMVLRAAVVPKCNRVLEEACRLVTVSEGDTVRKIPAIQAVLRSQFTLAAKGNGPAQRAFPWVTGHEGQLRPEQSGVRRRQHTLAWFGLSDVNHFQVHRMTVRKSHRERIEQ